MHISQLITEIFLSSLNIYHHHQVLLVELVIKHRQALNRVLCCVVAAVTIHKYFVNSSDVIANSIGVVM